MKTTRQQRPFVATKYNQFMICATLMTALLGGCAHGGSSASGETGEPRIQAAPTAPSAPAYDAELSAYAYRGSRLVEIPQAGHLPQVETFETYSKALLNFLDGPRS